MTVHPPSGLSSHAREIAEENIEEYLQRDFDDSPYNDPADGYAERTAMTHSTLDDKSAESIADEVFTECPYASRIVFVSCSDTTTAGSYWYVERNGGVTELVDQWDGYEGCHGNDAKQRVKEEHGVRGYANYEA